MAFTLYQSNRQEDLFALFSAVLHQPYQATVLTPDKVVIPSAGMAKWLSMALAEQTGIAANMAFELPAAFIWSLAQTLIPNVPDKSPYCPEVLTWRIDALLSTGAVIAPTIQRYLQQADRLQAYQLAQVLANLFDQYLIYRPDWIHCWEEKRLVGLSEDESWQAALWRMLSQEFGPHRAGYLQHLYTLLASPSAQLPARVLCFGISHLPTVYLTLLQKLGEVSDVHYFVMNPCKENWVDDRDYVEQLRLAGREDPEQLYIELGHPLLSSLAKSGRDFFAHLADVPSVDVFAEKEELPRDSLLHRVQADILCRTTSSLTEPSNPDPALYVHSCHSPMREIEVLYDTILHWLQMDNTLNPADILVLAPNIDVYAPYVDAVFMAPDTVSLPFSIADKNPLQNTAIFSTFQALLSLPTQRFDVDWVMNTINHPAVLRRFGLEMRDMPLLQAWVEKANIDWGRDGAHQMQYGLAAHEPHTWRNGLDRLLLAYALPQEMAKDALPIFADRVPFDTIAIMHSPIVAGFVALVEMLMHYAERLDRLQSPQSWVTELFTLIDAIFDPDEEEARDLSLIQSCITKIREEAEQAQCTSTLSVTVFAYLIQQRVGAIDTTHGFLGRGITFCNMVPLRAIPARVICVLGLNHDAFPRQANQIDMDLLRQFPRLGDRSRGQDDRYLFLETLLSARQYLHLSYIGQDIRTGLSLPPSVLIDELLDVIDQFYPLTDNARTLLVKQHYLQPFNAAYFKENSVLHSFQQTWLQAAKANLEEKCAARPLFLSALPEFVAPSPLMLESVLQFYRHPTRYLLQTRLNMVLPRPREHVETGILPNKKTRRYMRRRIIQYQADIQEMLRLEGVLPRGVFGVYPYQEEQSCMKKWLQIRQAQGLSAPLTLPIITIGAWQMHAVLPAVNTQHGILLESVDDIPSAYERIAAWLQHLVLCIAAPHGVCLQTTVSGVVQQYQYTPCTVDEARAWLLPWLDYFQQGMAMPLPFFVRTSLSFAEQLHRGKTSEEGLKTAAQIFLTRFGNWCEGSDPYLRAAYHSVPALGEDFIKIAQTLLLPMLKKGGYVSH